MASLVENLASQLDVSKAEAKRIISAFGIAVPKTINEEESFKIKGIGTFTYKYVAEKSGVSKMGGTEKAWTTPEHFELVVKADKEMISALNSEEGEEYLEKKGIPLYSELVNSEDTGSDADEEDDSEDDE